jgi:KaiC/GvpD/RAD55 family RecA-like ATPase
MSNADALAAIDAHRAAVERALLGPISLACVLKAEEHRLEEGVQRVPTGFPRLDAALGGGLVIPSLNVLGAAPKSGKSTWAQVVAVQHVERGGVAYYLDLENGRRRFLRQVLCRRAQLGGADVAAAMSAARAGAFSSRANAERWRAAKRWLSADIGPRLFAEFTPPENLEERLRGVRALEPDRPLLVVVDSLQKLPMNLEDRRASVDSWVRFFERLRHELDAVFLVISEIKRATSGRYEANESAFKESGGIEYAADLAATLTRPRADEGEEAVSTLRIELARDCDEDPRGEVASYAPVFPFYGLEERAPAARQAAKRRGPAPEKGAAARAFLEAALVSGPVAVEDLVRDGKAQGISRTTLYEVRGEMGLTTATANLRAAWRLP